MTSSVPVARSWLIEGGAWGLPVGVFVRSGVFPVDGGSKRRCC